METSASQSATEATGTSQSSEVPAHRLVIRVKIVSEAPPQPSVARQWNGRAIALALAVGVGTIAALTLAFVRSDLFTSEPTASTVSSATAESSSAARVSTPNEVTPAVTPALPHTESASTASTMLSAPETASSATEVQRPTDAPPRPVSEVMPDVPQSALQTIRGTVRVVVRVRIDREGGVQAASADVPGPSRYFERLSLEAAQKWTFTPADTTEERTMLVRFHFTRDGTTARAEQPL